MSSVSKIPLFLRLIAAAALSMIVVACSSTSQRAAPTTFAPKTIVNPAEGYRLEAGNTVRVQVFSQDNLSGDVTVDPTGTLALPLIGSIRAAGLTAAELARRIEKILIDNNLLQTPSVSVEVRTFRPFYVLGEVRQPGEFPYTTGLTVLSAVARAGGYDYRALENDVILVRVIDGKQQEFRADELTPILPGDIVRVRERLF